jgi:hypothetical protein
MGRAVTKAKRTGNVPFPVSFVLAPEGETRTPLAKLIQGGRGGETRLKLYMCLTMMATGHPFDIKSPPNSQTWAELLALPPDTGPRRVSTNLKWLKDNSYITLQPRKGRPASIQLLDPGLSGALYVRPLLQGTGRYVGVPVELWKNGWILSLSATALALLLVLLEHQGGHKQARYVVGPRRDRYGLSPDTWTLARKELEDDHKILQVGRTPQGTEFDWRRMRNTY